MYRHPLVQRSQNRALAGLAALLVALAFLPVAPVREAAAVATSSVDFDDNIQRASAGEVASPPASRASRPGQTALASLPIAAARRSISATLSRRRRARSSVVSTSCSPWFIATNQSSSR